VAVPSNFCSVCGLPHVAKEQELEVSVSTDRLNICQPESYHKIEGTVESEGLSASGVETTGLSDSADVQNKGSSDLCSVEFSRIEDIVESEGLPALSSVENTGLSDLADVQNNGSSDSFSVEFSRIANIVESEGLSASGVENKVLSEPADVQSKGSSDLCYAEFSRIEDIVESEVLSALSSLENKGLSEPADVQNKGSSDSYSVEFSRIEDIVESEVLSALSSVKNEGLFNSTDVQRRGSSDSCFERMDAVIGTNEYQENVAENTPRITIAADEYNHCEYQTGDGASPTSTQQSFHELHRVAQESTGHAMQSTTDCLQCNHESSLPNCEGIIVSEEVSMHEAASEDETVAETDMCLLSDSLLGELLSCAECGSSGLYFFLCSLFTI